MSEISPSLGVCYYPEHWPQSQWKEDAKRMAACGISYVRLAEFSWSRLEETRGRFSFEWLDQAIEILGAEGLKIIMCTPTATPPKWLVDEMPDMVAVGAERLLCFLCQHRIVCAMALRSFCTKKGGGTQIAQAHWSLGADRGPLRVGCAV